MNKYLLWDFDGTLGGRIDGHRGRAWSMSMLEAVLELYPERSLTIEDIAPHLKSGFPWHEPEKDHLHLHTPELWWEHLQDIFIRTYMALDFSHEIASHLAQLAQKRYVDLNQWGLFEDTITVLGKLQSQGWKHIIVSNHAPELESIVSHLGLDTYISSVVNSAKVGFEKPNRKIFEVALERAQQAEDIWMIGDNMNADVFGAEQMGIKAILVRNVDTRARYNFKDLRATEHFLLKNAPVI